MDRSFEIERVKYCSKNRRWECLHKTKDRVDLWPSLCSSRLILAQLSPGHGFEPQLPKAVEQLLKPKQSQKMRRQISNSWRFSLVHLCEWCEMFDRLAGQNFASTWLFSNAFGSWNLRLPTWIEWITCGLFGSCNYLLSSSQRFILMGRLDWMSGWLAS